MIPLRVVSDAKGGKQAVDDQDAAMEELRQVTQKVKDILVHTVA